MVFRRDAVEWSKGRLSKEAVGIEGTRLKKQVLDGTNGCPFASQFQGDELVDLQVAGLHEGLVGLVCSTW